jgi:serine protease Do
MKRIYWLCLALLVIIILTVGGCTLPGIKIINNSSNEAAVNTTPGIPSPINPTYSVPITVSSNIANPVVDFSPVISKVKPSVVAINTTVAGMNIFGGTFTQQGAGSGWIIDAGGGLIVTNNHVVEGASSISVTLEDGRNFSADTVRADSVSDLAVIRINASNLPASLTVGDSSKLRVGNMVIAIGNSLGEGISASMGIVSAIGMSVSTDQGETLYDLIQTDAAINPGNSGGPLINLAGEVVGINSIKVSQVGVEGMGYAISTQQAIPIINSLITTGYVTRPWLGVGLYTVDQTAIRQLRLSVSKGVLVTQVVASGPAGTAGIRQYDVITKIDGKEVTTREDLIKLVRNYQVGQTVVLTYWRNNTEFTASAILSETPRS